MIFCKILLKYEPMLTGDGEDRWMRSPFLEEEDPEDAEHLPPPRSVDDGEVDFPLNGDVSLTQQNSGRGRVASLESGCDQDVI